MPGPATAVSLANAAGPVGSAAGPSAASTPSAPPSARPGALPPIFGGIRPHPRGRELGLLAIVAVALLAGSVSLGATIHAKNGTTTIAPADPTLLAVYLGALLLAHFAQVIAGRRTDQVLLPTFGMLGGIGLLLMERLPQN